MCLRSGDEKPEQNVIKEYETLIADLKKKLSDAEQRIRAQTAQISALKDELEVARAARNVSASTWR